MEDDLLTVPTLLLQGEINSVMDEVSCVIKFFESQVKIEEDYIASLSRVAKIDTFPNLGVLNDSLIKAHTTLMHGIQENIVVSLAKWRDDICGSSDLAFSTIQNLDDGYNVGLSTLDNLKQVQTREAKLIDQLSSTEREKKFIECEALTKQYRVIFEQVGTYESKYYTQKRLYLRRILNHLRQTFELCEMAFRYYSSLLPDVLHHTEDVSQGKPVDRVWKFIEKSKRPPRPKIVFEPFVPKYDKSGSFMFDKVSTPIIINEDYFTDKNETENLVEFYIQYLSELFDGQKYEMQRAKKARDLLSTQEGRRGFAMALNQLRGKPQLSAGNFKLIGDLMYLALSKCEGDTGVGRIMFNMCQTYFRQPEKEETPQYLNHYLKNHSIWKTIDFWDQMLLDAIEDEKKHHKDCTKETIMNIAFGQLSAYAFNMLCMEIKLEVVSSFVDKYCTKYSLTQEYRQLVKSTVDSSSMTLISEKIKGEKEDLRNYSIIMDRSFLITKEKMKKGPIQLLQSQLQGVQMPSFLKLKK